MQRTVHKTVAIIMYAEAIKFFKKCMAYEWILSACTKLPVLQNFDKIIIPNLSLGMLSLITNAKLLTLPQGTSI